MKSSGSGWLVGFWFRLQAEHLNKRSDISQWQLWTSVTCAIVDFQPINWSVVHKYVLAQGARKQSSKLVSCVPRKWNERQQFILEMVRQRRLWLYVRSATAMMSFAASSDRFTIRISKVGLNRNCVRFSHAPHPTPCALAPIPAQGPCLSNQFLPKMVYFAFFYFRINANRAKKEMQGCRVLRTLTNFPELPFL